VLLSSIAQAGVEPVAVLAIGELARVDLAISELAGDRAGRL
jgi:hypothetical protein